MRARDSIISSGLNNLVDLGHGLWSRLSDTSRSHFDVYHEGWKLRGVFLRVPLTRFSLWLEWSDVSVGWGQAPTSQRDREVYLGRVDGFGQDEACDERDEGSKVSLCLLAA